MYAFLHREKIIKFNGIQLSNTGFKDLKFETSRYSDSLNTIRGFGTQMNESNLSVVETISVDFILKTNELRELAIIYNMFKAIGVLPIENDYLIKKIADTLSGGNETKYKVKSLLCFLERLQITSLEKTSNGYDVNMVLTLYQNSFTDDQHKEFQEKYKKWNSDTKFSEICNNNCSKYTNLLSSPSTSDLIMNVYNVEKLNAYYKENILDTEKVNKMLEGDEEIEATIEEQKRIDYLRRKLPAKDKYKPTSIVVQNKHILQIELITNNMISNFPIKGRPVGYKSFLGIGKISFGVKMIFGEMENDIVQELKRISDKSIVNHKIMLDHPLSQLFDFHSADITNITFNNIEQANGIIVTILFNINGFRYDEDEELLNSSDILLRRASSTNYINESIGGLYLESLANYLSKNRRRQIFDNKGLRSFALTPLESKSLNYNDGGELQDNTTIRKEYYYFIDFLSSYSSILTAFGYHFSNNNQFESHTLFSNVDRYNQAVNKNKQIEKKLLNNETIEIPKDIFGINYDFGVMNNSKNKEYNAKLQFYDCKLAYTLYKYIDSVSVYMIVGNKLYNERVHESLYNKEHTANAEYLIENVIKPIGIELFNKVKNSELPGYKVCSKIYEEFYYRLFDIYMNMSSVSDEIEKINKYAFVYNDGEINFKSIHDVIYSMVNDLLEAFVNSLKDEVFINRIVAETEKIYIVKDDQLEEKVVRVSRETVQETIDDLHNEIAFQFRNNLKEISDKIYNIFLSKLNYYLFLYVYDRESAVQYESTKLSLNTQIKVLLLSSCSFAPLLLRSKYRTDSFGETITLGAQNLGLKIKEYNKHLLGFDGTLTENENNPLCVMYKENNFNRVDANTYQLFTTLFGKKMALSYYLTILNNSNILPNDNHYITYDEATKKDCLYFYGEKIPRYDLHVEMEKVFTGKEDKHAFDSVTNFLSKAKEDFKNGTKYCSTEVNTYGVSIENFGFNSLKEIERFHFSDIASYAYELFLIPGLDQKNYLNDIMKNRIIGNNDMFCNLNNITKVVTDSTNTIIPDYVISITKKTVSSQYAGETNKFIEEEYELFANNISSISIVKDPKTKIKTATIEIVNIKKHVFSIGDDGSFNIKEMHNGDVEVIRIEPGDEIRIKLGYLHINNIFNGAISDIRFLGNSMVLTCTSYASLLYSLELPEVSLQTCDNGENLFSSGTWNGIQKVLDINEFSSSSSIKIRQLADKFNNEFNTNNHLFNIFGSIKFNDPLSFVAGHSSAQIGKSLFIREAGMFSFASIILRLLPRRMLEKLDGKLSNITSGKLVNEKILIKEADKVFGATSQRDDQTVDTLVGATFKNINNVDNDYETYGITSYGTAYRLKAAPYITDVHMPSENVEDTKEESKKDQNNETKNEETKNNEIVESLNNGESYLTHWPCAVKRITDLKGSKRTGYIHKGIDIGYFGAKSDVYAAADGTIEYVKNTNTGGEGRYIVIKHKIKDKEGKTITVFYTHYMHLLKNSLINENNKNQLWKKNDIVKGGQKIAKVGNSGGGKEDYYSAGHLHFEVRNVDNKTRLNPLDKNILPYYSDIVFKNDLNPNINKQVGSFGQYSDNKKFVN